LNPVEEAFKILVVRLSSLGDIVVLTPVFRALRRRFPGAQIDCLTKTEFQPLLQDNQFISRVLTFDTATGLAGWLNLCRQLRTASYDLYLDMHANLRSRILGYYLHQSRLLRFRKPRLKRFFLFYLYLNLFPKDFSLLSEYLKVLALLDLESEGLLPEIFLNKTSINSVEIILKNHQISGSFVVLLPIATWINKRYSIERYKELAARIWETYHLPVIWLGGKEDRYLWEAGISGEAGNILLVGETSLVESLAILSRSTLVIGNDTGLSYAAEALGVPLIMILGPTSRETGAGPNCPGGYAIQQQLWCRPCSQKGDRRCYRRRRYCLEDIKVDEIFQTASAVLNRMKS
jgi:heptosyltransferase-2